jgi:hypothetical protein
VNWAVPHDWNGQGVGRFGVWPEGEGYPHFTQEEWNHMAQKIDLDGQIDSNRMKNWDGSYGPKVRASSPSFYFADCS